MTEMTTTEQPVVMEGTEEDDARMAELDAAIAEHGIEGGEPDEGTRGLGSAQSMIAEAKKHLGYRESGDNDAKFNHWLGTISGTFRYPWCHCFVSYCLWHSDNAGTGPRTAGCLAGVGWFKAQGRFGNVPHVGDLVYYGPGGGRHVELVVGVSADSIETVGGNTSGFGATGSRLFNGDGVYQKRVKRTPDIFGYGSPKYASGAADPGKGGGSTGSTVEPWTNVRSIRKQQEAVNSLGRTPPLGVDGEWGPKTEQGVKWLQKRIGCTEVDGQWGQETEKLFKAFS
jgi:CHAP domain/Putative peptidoglycan binding domain